jgi:tungstate transport system substrate-binding protein
VRRRSYLQAIGLGGSVSIAGCVGTSRSSRRAAASGETLTLATATTAHDSGLIGELAPEFKATFGATLRTVVRGTGAALRTARDGDCDVVLVHARSLEDPFLRAGYGINRRRLMTNDFLLVGPPDDPAGAAGRTPAAAFQAVAKAELSFLSRGDRSGTHVREQQIWTAAEINPSGQWYRETGRGMGETLVTAEQIGAYTLTDRGTYLNVSADGPLVPHIDHGIEEPPTLLRNEYAIIPVNPARHQGAYPLAMAFVGYLTGPAQPTIAEFQVAGERAFRPVAKTPRPDFGQYVPTEWTGENG